MTKKRLIALFIALTVIGGIYLLYSRRGPALPPTSSRPNVSTPAKKHHQIDIEKLSIDGKKVVGLAPGKEQEEIKQMKLANSPSPQWEENLIDSLKTQGGAEVKDIVIMRTDSFIWNHDGVGLFVESANVTLTNQKNEKTSFSVLVDSQTGKILQNWGQPVVDPANPRDSFRIKLDPRYQTE